MSNQQVDELYEKVKDLPGLDKALADLEQAGLIPRTQSCPSQRLSAEMGIFLHLLLQLQVENKFRWVPVSAIVDRMPEWRALDNRPVPGQIFKNCVEGLAGKGLLEFDLDSQPKWDLQTTRCKLTAPGVYSAMVVGGR